MHSFSVVLAFLGTVHSLVASPVVVNSDYVLKETHNVPPGWTEKGVPHPLHPIKLNIGLRAHNMGLLKQHLHEVSSPSHHRYGQHLSRQEVTDLIRPTSDVTEQVQDWLLAHHIPVEECKSSSTGQWITITLPVYQIESLLSTRYSIFEHDSGARLVRTTSYYLPSTLHSHITTIQPTTSFLRANPKGETVLSAPLDSVDIDALTAVPNATTLNSVCNFGGMTPTCLRALYGTIDYVPQSASKNRVAFTNYLGQISNRSDAAIFLRNFRPDALSSAYNHTQISIENGGVDNSTAGAGVEGNLDLQTILGQVYPTPVTVYSTGGVPPFHPDDWTPSNTNEPYLEWVLYMLDSPAGKLPKVISTSYGDDEQTVPRAYAEQVCDQFALLGVQGVSLFFSSGDYGVGGNGSCITNDGARTRTFLPIFPASCPYVTAVGGTKNFPEVVATDSRNGYASGAGFSNYFARPAWQDDVVPRYVDGLGEKYDGLYNKSGRAYPDVAAQGYRYIIFYNASVRSVDGTSCSAPTVASLFSLVNDALIAKGKPVLGWLNPWLYERGRKGFTDVVNGSAVGCEVDGFSAGKGWDVASGWGTPDFAKILDILGVGNTTTSTLAESQGVSRVRGLEHYTGGTHDIICQSKATK